MFAAALRSRVCQYNVDHPLDTCGCAGNYNTATVSTENGGRPRTCTGWERRGGTVPTTAQPINTS